MSESAYRVVINTSGISVVLPVIYNWKSAVKFGANVLPVVYHWNISGITSVFQLYTNGNQR